ncbi:MAG: peroxide stress protein YaaA [Caulobacter sp.]|nr:peroxide stress protein YaaA [Caulobacter sp.]
MLMVISPAKALDFTAPPKPLPLTEARLKADTVELAKVAKGQSARQLKRLMHLSDALASLNHARFQAFDPNGEEGLQAAVAFNGDVYTGLSARTLDKAAFAWAQDHLRILSGLYGLLRPADAIQPYRLEMGTRLKTKRGSNLYDFWGDKVARQLNDDARGHADPTLINLASQEYFGAVDAAALKLPVVTCRFLEEKDGETRQLSFFAKQARGLMARFAIDQRIERAADLKAFDTAGYAFKSQLSNDLDWVFARPQPPPVAQQRAAARNSSKDEL